MNPNVRMGEDVDVEDDDDDDDEYTTCSESEYCNNKDDTTNNTSLSSTAVVVPVVPISLTNEANSCPSSSIPTRASNLSTSPWFNNLFAKIDSYSN